MTRRSTLGLVVVVLFNVVNLAGAVYAAALGETLHAALHAALLLPGAYALWRLVPARDGRSRWPGRTAVAPAGADELPDRLTRLADSVDAVALEVERIGEGQRFATRVLTERDAPRVPGASGDAAPVERAGRDAAVPTQRA
jgi:hypothetical protein